MDIKRRKFVARSLCGGGKAGRGGQWAWRYFDIARIGRPSDDITVQCPWLAYVNMAAAEYLINFHQDKIDVPASHLTRRILSNEYFNHMKLLQPIDPRTLGGHYAVQVWTPNLNCGTLLPWQCQPECAVALETRSRAAGGAPGDSEGAMLLAPGRASGRPRGLAVHGN